MNGYAHGKGKHFYSDGSFYEGDYKNNNNNGKGKGKFFHADGSI